MPYKIAPEPPGNWDLKVSEERALVETENHKFHIPPFQIDAEFTSQFLAVGIKVSPSGENWRFGGYLSQHYPFEASGYLQEGLAFYKSADLEINNVSIVLLPLKTDKPYKLTFFPPNWFRSLKLEIWEYTGAVVETGTGEGSTTAERLIEALSQLMIERLDEILSYVSSGSGGNNGQTPSTNEPSPTEGETGEEGEPPSNPPPDNEEEDSQSVKPPSPPTESQSNFFIFF